MGGYALGCRGYPGVVVELRSSIMYPFDSDLTIKTLHNGGSENCSIYHCGPEAISKESAEAFAALIKEHGFTKANIIHFKAEGYKEWEKLWIDPEVVNEYKSSVTTLQEYFGLNDEEFALYRQYVPEGSVTV